MFYREAGPKGAPTILLLHGFPSSSRMFEPLFARVSDRYHVVGPTIRASDTATGPTQSNSLIPSTTSLPWSTISRKRCVCHTTRFICRTRVGRLAFAWYWHIRSECRLSSSRMQWLTTKALEPSGQRRAFWANRPAHEEALRENFLSLATTKSRDIGDDPNIERYDPDLWTDEYRFLNAPGQAQIQTDLFYDYRTNVAAYPQWQAWLQKTQPKLLVLWGKHDPSFDISEPERYRKDVPKAGVYLLDAGTSRLIPKQMRLRRCYVSSYRCRSKRSTRLL
jgi:pimeloyl-ACP methyl ester carboxylesterase